MSKLIPFSGLYDFAFAQTLAFVLLCLPIAAVFYMYLDVLLLLASNHLENVPLGLDRPAAFADRLQISVISLPDRHERRVEIDRLMHALGLHWEYYDALPADNPSTGQILDWVRAVRSLNPPSPNSTLITWPEHLDDIAKSIQEIPLMNPDIWRFPKSEPPYQSLIVNEQDYEFPAYGPNDVVPEFMFLTAGKVACWQSHLSVIHEYANSLSSRKANIALILEDDVDMERDVISQMEFLWASLPEDWDMAFLGHCWSDETKGSLLPIPAPSIGLPHRTFTGSRMYASSAPKCTHAYAVSRIGARRLMLYLTHPLFAYSRAIDQAFAWLVQSKRIKSFSIVPNLAMQRKVMPSDVNGGGVLNDQWKDTLINGVLAMLDHTP